MEIKGKIHCFFEQSGTFKNEFKKLGYDDAFDYDLRNNFNQTDFVMDLFAEIEKGYNGENSIFDTITSDDLILAFFPCIHFCDAKAMAFKCSSYNQRKMKMHEIMKQNIEYSKERELFYRLLLMLFSVVSEKGLRMIVENPWNGSGEGYLQRNFLSPSYIDKNRTKRGDFFIKPTAYWFFNCKPTDGFTSQQTRKENIKSILTSKGGVKAGLCSEERSMISPEYARNFICDNILGITQKIPNQQLTLF